MVDFALQRKNMVESQVRPSDITDRRIIRAMLELPREAFCPQAFQSTAYRDEMLQINVARGPSARHTMAPRTLAKMVQALELGDSDRVLEIGTGTGYAAAVLARIAHSVVCVEADTDLVGQARSALAAVAASNVTVIQGEAALGYAPGAPYDAILISGAVPTVPRGVLDQLKDGGRLVTVSSRGTFGPIAVWRRMGGAFDSQSSLDAAAPVLPGFASPAEFVF